MKNFTAAFTILGALAIVGCGLFGSGEAVRQDPGRTVYRAAEAPPDLPDITPVRQEVPGRSVDGRPKFYAEDSGRYKLCCHRILTLIPLLVSRLFRIVAGVETTAQELSIPAEKNAAGYRRRTAESAIRAFFGSNALVAIIGLTLITIFLFREGSGFFGQNLANLRLYRQAGLEYVDIIRGQAEKADGSLASTRRHPASTNASRSRPGGARKIR